MATVMKLLQLLLMGFLLQHVQATNDSRQDIQFEDWLSLFFDTNVNPNRTLIPMMDITQNQMMNFLCSENMAFNNGFSVVNNASSIHKGFRNATANETKTANTQLDMAVFGSYSSSSVVERIIIVTGILGNFLTMVYIPLQKKLRKPFYYCIVNLALGDLIALFVNPYSYNVLFSNLIQGPCTDVFYQFIFETINIFSKLFSEIGVLILGYVRFMLFVHPFESRTYLTKNRVFLSFCLSFVISAGYGYLTNYFISDTKGAQYIITSSVVDGFSFILMFVILLVLFYHRYRTARMSVSAQNTKLPMTVVTIIILVLNAFNVAVSLVNNLRYLPFNNKGIFFNVFDTFFIIASAIVHSVNPLIYFIRFNAVRRIRISFLSKRNN